MADLLKIARRMALIILGLIAVLSGVSCNRSGWVNDVPVYGLYGVRPPDGLPGITLESLNYEPDEIRLRSITVFEVTANVPEQYGSFDSEYYAVVVSLDTAENPSTLTNPLYKLKLYDQGQGVDEAKADGVFTGGLYLEDLIGEVSDVNIDAVLEFYGEDKESFPLRMIQGEQIDILPAE